jgi:probable HAF family extracellular repeat protein
MLFPPTAPWWSARMSMPESIFIFRVPFAGRRRVGCKTSARCRAAVVARLGVFPPMAPWWSAWLKTPHRYYRAFRWQNGVMQDLGTLGGNESWALGVSADGSVVVGEAQNAAGQERAFRWTASGGMQDLGTLGGIR